MGRFSCFYGHHQSHKQKKSAQPSFETMIKMLQVGSPNRVSTNSINSTTMHKFPTVENDANNLSDGSEHVTMSLRGWKSGELNCEYHDVSNIDFVPCGIGNFRRSLSVGCELDQQAMIYGDNTDDQGFSCDGSRDCKETAESLAPNDLKSRRITLPDPDQEANLSVSLHLSSDLVNHESVFYAGDSHYLGMEGHEGFETPLQTECAEKFCGQTTPTHSMISKSYSMPNFESSPPTSPDCSPHTRNRSFEDLNNLNTREEDASAPGGSTPDNEITELNKDDTCRNFEKYEGENAVQDGYDSYYYAYSSEDWIVPVSNEIEMMRHEQAGSSSHHRDHFQNVDFKIKRIEDWVIDLQHCSPVEEANEITGADDDVKRCSSFLDSQGAAKIEPKINPGMEAAKRYISSLNASCTTAQLANHGLAVVPLLSAFVSLKVLNLSGNSIVRITAGALPRGLHMLNLSKNKISTIEGLRELTRLRVLDMSYNKISRIGHGLASCSSLKELYVAGNKISEVEGLHRLLKLAVLDLRFNKIATSKCLGQLAANYNSLQAISLEGNPAQKNVGDEQLKKYLLSLLPHLAYYNRQHIKTSTLKDSSDRSVRLGISAHQFDRGLRSDHKSSSRRGGLKRSSHSSSQGQKGPSTDTLKPSRGRHGLVPPSGTRTSHHHHHQFDLGNKVQSLSLGVSMHRSRSESTLAAL